MGAVVRTQTVELFVTGFGPFYKVVDNPSSAIVRRLPGYFALRREDSPHLEGVGLGSSEVLDVSGSAVRAYLDEERIRTVSPPDTRTVHLHIGVDVSSPNFRLEKRAVNEAHYTCPDERGWQPCHEKVEQTGPEYRNTKLPVDQLAEQMRQQSFDCEVSLDAGKFVCNTTYYMSLGVTETAADQYSLFVHVPSDKTISLDKQMKFIISLVERIVQLL